MTLMEANTPVLDRLEDADGGVGGAEGRKMDGMQDTVAMMETMRTILSTEPRKGLISCASLFRSASFSGIY
jgi:hypothetical protein